MALALGLALGALRSGDWQAAISHQHKGESLAALVCLVIALVGGAAPVVPKGIKSLAAIQPDMNALVLVASVAVGSLIRVRPGEHVPCDGEVENGISGVNESMLTGEPVPTMKRSGDTVYAGTFNSDGVLDIRTTREADDTPLARILRLLEESQHCRAPSEQFVDRFARYYTPTMFLVAVGVAVGPPLLAGEPFSPWFYRGMLTLLISCPCALVISTPVASAAAVAKAARRGLLIKAEARARLGSDSDTVVICGEGDTPWALVRFRDRVRPEASSVVAELRELGIAQTMVLSGDHRAAVESVREAVGIDEARAPLLPEDKRVAIEEIESSYGRAAMVGDGVNDAEALVAFSLGIGVGGTGADIALESAEVVLMSPRLELLPDLIRTGRLCPRVIRQNVAIALGFKLLFLVLAAQNMATLWLAVAADMGATLVVIFNGLRLLHSSQPRTR